MSDVEPTDWSAVLEATRNAMTGKTGMELVIEQGLPMRSMPRGGLRFAYPEGTEAPSPEGEGLPPKV